MEPEVSPGREPQADPVSAHADRRGRSACSPGRAVRLVVALLLGVGASMASAAELWITYTDAAGDVVARRTDPGADGPFDPESHRLVELLELTLSKWKPDDTQEDLFTGYCHASGKFLRLDIVVDGLINPPGPTRPWEFDPFTYGDNPIYGFVEVDVDADVETGGELDAPEYRYVGNIVRFGNKPFEPVALEDRIALDASAFDGDFLTPPYVDQSGEEFHLALLGSVFTPLDIVEVVGDADLLFEGGETWWIEAPWFHRAHGYEPFSLALGGAQPGEYSPACTLQFEHDPLLDVTTISLVFPLKNVGAGEMWGEPPEPPNGDPSDQFSVFEALKDLVDSAIFLDWYPTGLPEEDIITEWQNKEPEDYLLPSAWGISALLGTSYTVADQGGEYFVWTDAYPDGIRGDVNGDAEADEQDRQLIEQFIADEDANDGTVDGRAELAGFAFGFSVFDVNHGGVVDELDDWLVSPPGDMDDDADIDLVDFASLQRCFSGAGSPYAPLACGLGDLDADNDVDEMDADWFGTAMAGPE